MMLIYYKDIISLENLHQSWREFVRGKKYKKDVAEFSMNLAQNIYHLHEELKNRTYHHGNYIAFAINDPKPRNIHKATVRDRLLHHAVYRILYPYFDKKFIYDSYSCRDVKGTHRAADRFNHFYNKVSKNNHRTCWVLKCDIEKFFASIDQSILMKILRRHIYDEDIIGLIENIVLSFSANIGKGLPLGNLTSQLLVNIYMNEFDQFVKHVLKQRYYIRYADDFVIMADSYEELIIVLSKVHKFLFSELNLKLHPDKVYIKTFSSGVDFIGWVNFSDHKVLRTATKKRMFRNINVDTKDEVIQSYLGLLSHGNTFKLRNKIQKIAKL